MDFNKLIQPLSKYYSAEAVEKSIQALNEWYEEEAYDDDDIIADWQPDAFEDCEGILQLAASLHEDNGTVLYTHCLYYLLPHQPVPATPLIPRTMSSEEPLEQLHREFKTKLMEKLHFSAEDAKHIADVFQTHIEEEEYDMECVEDDLANLDESEIMDNIMNKFPKLKDRSGIIFHILSSLTSSSDSDVLTLQMYSSPQQQDEAAELCRKYLVGMFQDPDSANNENSKNKDGFAERCFLTAKSWDISNQFPWVLCMMDTFIRYRVESHKQLCEENKDNAPNTSDKFMDMEPNQWFETVDPSTKKLIEQDADNANVLKHAVMSLGKRLSPRIPLNYKISNTIWDSVNVYAKYALAIQKFVTRVSRSNDLHCAPIQFDCMVIPQCVSNPLYLDTQVDLDDLFSEPLPDCVMQSMDPIPKAETTQKYLYFGQGDNAQSMFDNDGDDDDDDDDNPYNSSINNGNTSGKNESKAIWDLEYNLKGSGYSSGVDYIGPVEVEQVQNSGKDVNINGLERILNENLFMNVKGADSTRYKRYIIVIDRRDPMNIKHKRMKYSEKKTWNDRLYLICPKQADRICMEYQYKMNETFIQNTKDFILPMGGGAGLGGLESGNGYRFLLSFHVHSEEKVKAYWYFQGGSQRFFMSDIEWLWPRFFVKRKNQFQSLTKETKDELTRAQKEYPLIDKQFTRYRQGYKLVN